MYFNYLDLSRRFWKLHKQEAFMPSDTHVYWCLVNAFNEKGSKQMWPEFMTYTDGSLADLAGVNSKTLEKAVERLTQRGLITTSGKTKGGRKGVNYALTSPSTYPKNGDVTGEVDGEVDYESAPTSPKNGKVSGEVNGQPLHQPSQQPLHQPTQKLERSYIYIESKQPDIQTLKKRLLVAHRNESAVLMSWFWHLKNPFKKKPPRSASPPTVVTLIRQVVEQKVDGYYWQAKDGGAARDIASKLRNAIQKKEPNCTDQHVIDAFEVLIEKMKGLPPYFQFTDLPALNGKFNEIISQLRIPRTNAPNQRPVAPAHASSEQRVSKVAALFNRIDERTGRSSGG